MFLHKIKILIKHINETPLIFSPLTLNKDIKTNFPSESCVNSCSIKEILWKHNAVIDMALFSNRPFFLLDA